MFQLTKEMLSKWDNLPEDACISGKELCEVTKLCPQQLGGYVRCGYLPPSMYIVPKNSFQTSGFKPLWKLKVLRSWVNTEPEYRVTKRDLEKRQV